jgi:alkylation response protein AidB-like acyl-CoA dehydrogenase
MTPPAAAVGAAEHLDLSYDDAQEALAESVRGYVSRHQHGAESESPGDGGASLQFAPGSPDWQLWRGLADLGVLALGTPEGGGGPLEIAAVMEVLGELRAPGPLVGTFMASHLLDEDSRAGVVDGSAIVAIGNPPVLPWAAVAGVFIELGSEGAWSARPVGPVEPVESMAGEPWGRVTLERIAPLESVSQATTVGDVALAAYLTGAAQHLLTTTATWAQDRVQFGQPIGDFQSVGHPLADLAVHVRATRGLVRAAAYAAATGPGERAAAATAATAATARLSATRAAVDASYRAHQAFGALGYTVEGPVARVAQQIRQVSLHPPGPAHARDAVLAAHGL